MVEESSAALNSAVYERRNDFTLDDAKKLDKPTPKILCALDDNQTIRFGEYIVRDHDSQTTLLQVTEEENHLND